MPSRSPARSGSGSAGAATSPRPPGAVRFAPLPAYAQWWAMTGACAGRTSDFATSTWYVVPGNAIPEGCAGNVAAYADVVARRVVFASPWKGDGPTVRHEMLHTLLGPAYASGDLALQHRGSG